LKKYKTLELKSWGEDRQVYIWHFSTNEEEIIDNTYTWATVNKLNQEGYFISATYIERHKVVYVMTKEIEE